VGFFQPEEYNPGPPQPGDFKCRHTMRCDVSVILSLAEIRFGAEQRFDVSGGETCKGPDCWLIVMGNDKRFPGVEEDPSRGRRTEDCVDEDLGRPEPRESVERRASEEVY